MKISSRVAFVTAIHTGIFFLILFCIGVLEKNLPVLFDSTVIHYRILCGFSLALEWLPALLLSGVLLGFSWAFSSFNTKNILRFSPVLMQNFKTVIRISFFCAILCFCSAEIFMPLIENSKKRMSDTAVDFAWYQDMAQNSLDRELFSDAYFYNNTAISLAGKDAEHRQLALDFRNKLEMSDIKFKTMSLRKQDDMSVIPANQNIFLTHGKTATELLELARVAFNKGSYFDAHYNAEMAASICGDDNPNRAEMLHIASKAWNKLEDWRDVNDTESEMFFSKKREAYTALLNGDVLESYYSFLTLSKKYSTDPDVKKYLVIAKEALTKQYFFIEETSFIKHFEIARDVYFTIPRDDGGFILIYIRGISISKSSGSVIQYLRGFNYISFSKDSHMEMSCRVPFAKLKGDSLNSFAGNLKFEKIENTALVPVILLNSVSEFNSDIKSTPIYKYGDGIPNINYRHLILPITLDEFNDACQASAGVKKMALFDLFSFARIAARFGFSTEVFGTELLSRISYPFILLLLFIIAAIFGWNYRLGFGEIFKFTWIFIFPLTAVIVKLIIEVINYGLSMIYFILFGNFGILSLIFALVVFIFAFLLAGVRFLGLHGENFYEDEKSEED